MDWFNHDPAFDYFNTMDSTTVATVVLAFDEKDIENTYDGTGFVIARTSNTSITACTWTSKMAIYNSRRKSVNPSLCW